MLVLYHTMTVATTLFCLHMSAGIGACLYYTETMAVATTLFCLHKSAGIGACLYNHDHDRRYDAVLSS